MQQFIVDAFESGPFTGNPAAVIPLQDWLLDDVMQKIAGENNLSETAFFAPGEEGYDLRWFTPTTEVDLCGHATLASAHVIFEELELDIERIEFSTRSGMLGVTRADTGLALNFPAVEAIPAAAPAGLFDALGGEGEVFRAAGDYLVVFPTESDVLDCNPDLASLEKIECRGICITAAGAEVDFVSRVFAPQVGIDEDPATGSTHCVLAPYWGEQLDKLQLDSLQASARTGRFACTWLPDAGRVEIAGSCRTFSRGTIEI
ncbi:MAG: PhzF family phenazine biosynthesis protein [Solirubrobacterales bacterium]